MSFHHAVKWHDYQFPETLNHTYRVVDGIFNWQLVENAEHYAIQFSKVGINCLFQETCRKFSEELWPQYDFLCYS